ncbi:hypothetical protein EYF80_061680 [Liparis tanakae]|uniref:Uncharacterized protein n=1 Tax=Liparis tanakae TaxID=230148 RepID=A0A4Z2EIJ6_9TELE|nr:hypothetical protein EYF80_061680 [Liparis tanakae]
MVQIKMRRAGSTFLLRLCSFSPSEVLKRWCASQPAVLVQVQGGQVDRGPSTTGDREA